MKRAVIISCFDWYEKRLKPIKEFLENKGYKVVIYTSDFDHVEKKEIRKRIGCKYIHVVPYKRNLSLKRIQSHIHFGKAIYSKLEKYKPDVVYALIPPNVVAKYCAKYKRNNLNVKLFFDIIDMWPESMPFGGNNNILPYNIWRSLRDNNLSVADFIITECSLYQEKLKDYFPDNYGTLYLFKEENKVNSSIIRDHICKYENEKEKDVIRLGYLGSINNIIDIDRIEGVVKKIGCSGIKVECHIIGDGESRKEFVKRLKKYSKVFYYGKIFDEEKKIEILSNCDYGINIMKDSVSVGLSIKSIDYFSYGLPILNNLKGDTLNFVEKYNVGINVDQKFDFDNSVLNQICHRKKNARSLFEHYFSYECFYEQLLEYMKDIDKFQ